MLYGYNNGHRGVCCDVLEMEHQEEAKEMIRKWSQEHPVITNADKFEEVFWICGGDECPPIDCRGIVCTECEYNEGNWWNEEYKAPTKE